MSLVEKIKNKEVTAFCLDTNIFIKKGSRCFLSDKIKLLASYLSDDFFWVIPEILVHEMKKHSAERYGPLYKDVIKAMRALEKYPGCQGRFESLKEVPSHEEVIDKNLQELMSTSRGIKIIDEAEYADLNEIVRDYAKTSGAFVEGKKDEFPDAIALSSLKGWAQRNNTKVVCLSEDGDWDSYVNYNPDYFYLVRDLDSFISDLHLSLKENKPIIDYIKIFVKDFDEEGSDIYNDFLLELEAYMNIDFFEPVIPSAHETSIEIDNINLKEWWIDEDDNEFSILDSEDHYVTFSFYLVVRLEAICQIEVVDDTGYELGGETQAKDFTLKRKITVKLEVEEKEEIFHVSILDLDGLDYHKLQFDEVEWDLN